MSSAKEMFKELGFGFCEEYTIDDGTKYIDYRDEFDKEGYTKQRVRINDKGEIVFSIIPDRFLNNILITLNSDLVKASMRQLVELGYMQNKTENNIKNNTENDVYREALITLLNRIDFEEFCNVYCYRDNGCDGNAGVKCYGEKPIFSLCADDFDSIVEDTADALAEDEG